MISSAHLTLSMAAPMSSASFNVMMVADTRCTVESYATSGTCRRLAIGQVVGDRARTRGATYWVSMREIAPSSAARSPVFSSTVINVRR